MAFRTLTLFSSLLLAAATAAGHAAELGDAQVRSHIGQALVADVELTLVEEPGKPVAVRLAHADVYRGANIAMPPVLSSLAMTVMRRDGRQFLHLTSLKPVESRHLHLYLELADGGQRSVRLVTLWLTPDPNPAPPPPPVPETPKLQPAPQLPAPARAPVPAPRLAAALHAGEEYVEAGGPTPPVPRKAAPRPAPVKKAAAPMKAAAEAPSCAPQAPSAHVDACVALGEKNTALHRQLDRLEDKVKLLQGTAPPAPPRPVAASAPAAQATPGDAPTGAPRIHRKPKKAEPPAPDTPWQLIGAGLAAMLALGALVLMLLRRRHGAGFGKIAALHKPAKLPKAAPVPGAPTPHFMAAVKARLMPGRGKGTPSKAAEPVLDDAISQPEQGTHESITHP
ncbi:hypothetical protein ACFPOU_13590 [Massilia jejuensis]|uniref:FimV N-terminal domain-containing protein n=1 Tax=Massilia jejuensis TaxID=648894 RepID=A0ABW0PI10_9BURK